VNDLTLRDKLQAEFAFFHSVDPSKVAKILARWELYKLTVGLPGKLAEFGVFHGSSLCQFAIFRTLFGLPVSKQIVAFDTFGAFPHPRREDDQEARARFVEALREMSMISRRCAQSSSAAAWTATSSSSPAMSTRRCLPRGAS
jgi:hypothetical protein